ncbi:SAM-dependent methyltransferase [Aquincola sp. S2]|uniref:SAM-dependent methyltransferase n=1 Tax=Pseudaquabacterium terrae TaxID=2732868 RepID=A0ABX2EDS1_9BURK|nr:SAM-dependent methyltransferase [Aquabacterium terrae]NRF66715.1 SAM-dependent methyltransferase [Aquabacterium terrae]
MDAASEPDSVSSRLRLLLREAILAAGGWLPFDRYMAIALYEPGLGYYAHGSPKFGTMPASGSDFVTAPELSPHFGRALAVQLRQALQAGEATTVYEFGAGSGALAEQLLEALGAAVERYRIVDLSGSLRARQAARLQRFGDRVQWLDRLPDAMHGVVIGNEVLDAMPVQLLHWDGDAWLERGVVMKQGAFAWADRASALHPPLDGPFVPGTITEIHPQAEAFVRSVADRLQRGAAFFIDYGFPEAEYYHPQRHGGTLMCHRGHRADSDPLQDPGSKDITAHVNFTGIALAGQEAGLEVLGYTSQARFLLNCGLLPLLESATIAERAMAQKLITEHEMGELFKVIGFAKGCSFDALGFASGDRSHRL